MDYSMPTGEPAGSIPNVVALRGAIKGEGACPGSGSSQAVPSTQLLLE
jgi:hypothetical protein